MRKILILMTYPLWKVNKYFLFLLLLLSSIIYCPSQTTSNYFPNEPKIRPTSPNASALGEYGKIPVSYFNGTSDISIPLYEIDINGLKVPISLKYNSSGIKVSQEATCVGLGWSLNAGGCITRQINDGDDYSDNLKSGRTKIPYYNALDSLKSILNTDIYNLSSQRIRNYDDFLEIMDTEPDIYFFNFCNYQGSTFFPYKSSNVEFKGYIKNINQYLNINWNALHDQLIVFDGYGYKFNFGSKTESREFTDGNAQNYDGVLSTMNSVRFNSDSYYANLMTSSYIAYMKSKTAFYLDKITSPLGDSVLFNYSQDTIYTVPTTSESYKLQLNNFLKPDQAAETEVGLINNYCSTISNARISQSILQKIQFKNGCIEFITSYSRKDLESATNQRAQRLTDIVIKRDSNNTLVELKRYKLYTSYLGDTVSNISCRLLLDSIIEVSKDGVKNQRYVFTYNKGSLPVKNSRQTDYWGYYNKSKGPSKWGIQTLDFSEEGSAISSYTLDNQLIDIPYPYQLGRNRMPDKDRMQYGILTKIIYPTGGETEFTYEPHDFSNSFTFENSELKGITDSDLGLAFTTPVDNSNGNLILMTTGNTSNPYQVPLSNYLSTTEYKKNNRVFVSFKINSNCDVTTKTFSKIDISLVNSSGLTKLYSRSIDFDQDKDNVENFVLPREGKLLVTLTPTYNYVTQNPTYNNVAKSLRLSVKLSYIKGLDTLNYGGGLRIKEIYNYIKFGTSKVTSSYKKINYINYKGVTSGHLYCTPKMMGSYTQQIAIPGIAYAPTGMETFLDGPDNNYTLVYCPYIDTLHDLLFSSTPFANCMFTSDVAYDQVEELESKDNTNMRTVFKYYVDSNYKSPSFIGDKIFVEGENSLPLSIKQYDKNNKPIHELSYKYERDSNEEVSVKGLSKQLNFPWFDIVKCEQLDLVAFRRTVPIYSYNLYALKSDWYKKTQEIDKSYYNQGNDSIVKTVQLSYDSINYLCNKTTSTSSEGRIIDELVTYSHNNSFMKDENKLNYAIAKSKYVDNVFIESLTNDYSRYDLGQVSTSLLSSVSHKYGTSPNKLFVEYLGYDICGNPQSIRLDNSQITTYIWSYNGQHPIFEISNASYEEVKTALGYNDSQMVSLTQSSMPDILLLRQKLEAGLRQKNALITSYGYKPLIGLIYKTDSRGVTTYYNYDSMNRLQIIKDTYGNKLQYFNYNYQH